MSSYDVENAAADFIAFVKQAQAYAGHEQSAMRLAKALEIRVRVGLQNQSVPESEPSPIIQVQPWFYGYNNDVLYHEINHVLMWWSNLEEHIRAEFGDEDGWKIIENLCNQAIVFLRLPQPLVDSTINHYGVSAVAVAELCDVGGVRPADAMRRLVYDEPAAQRAGFIMQGDYVAEVALCNFRLPFWWLDRVPNPHALFPSSAGLSLSRVGWRNVVGVVGES